MVVFDMFNMFKELLLDVIKQFGVVVDDSEIENSISVPDIDRGDISTSVSFLIARRMKRNPSDVASMIAEELEKHEIFSSVKSTGPYVNAFFSPKFVQDALLRIEKMPPVNVKGHFDFSRGEIYVDCIIEFPSVNPNKPWHLGHLRNALLGDTIANLKSANGYKVLRMDYIDDLGLQVAETIYGLSNLNLDANKNEKFDHYLGTVYVDISKQIETNPNIEQKVRETLMQMEDPNSTVSKYARNIVESCVKAQYETAYFLGIFHDLLMFETDVVRYILDSGLERLKENNIVYTPKTGKNAGCVVVDLSEHLRKTFGVKSEQKVLIRSDGTATYTGKDLIFHMWKFGILDKAVNFSIFDEPHNTYSSSPSGVPGKIILSDRGFLINIIGSEQAYPQAFVLDTIHRMGYRDKKLIHISYEHVRMSSGRFSGRHGTWKGYTADDFFSEMKNKIKQTFYSDKRASPDAISKIAVGAIRYSFLKVSPKKQIVFDWNEALDTNGNSGVYLQYALVRAKSIVNKIGSNAFTDRTTMGDYTLSDKERRLVMSILSTYSVIRSAGLDPQAYDIVSICDHAYQLAVNFNKFYTEHRVIGAETKSAEAFRISLVKSFIHTLSDLFIILGIPELERM